MRYSATEEELLQSLSNTRSIPAEGNAVKYRLQYSENLHERTGGLRALRLKKFGQQSTIYIRTHSARKMKIGFMRKIG